MTREEMIVSELNKYEQRFKKAILSNDKNEIKAASAYIDGMHKMAKLLGYKVVCDDDRCENINGYWVNTYTSVEDIR